ncbi:hypothetical protein EOM82_05985 [bacterium]|nr:hypothetical protein [bacterium]
MFGKLYLGEIKKQLRPKTIITLAVFFVIFFIIFAIVYNIDLEGMFQENNITTVDEQGQEVEMTIEEFLTMTLNQNNVFKDVNQFNVDIAIDDAKRDLEEAIARDKINNTNEAYYQRGVVTVLEYIKANNINGADMKIEGLADYKGLNSAEGFVSSYFNIVLIILSIYGIVMAAGIFADEYRNGTIKLLMMRPITRNQLTTAKLLGAYTVILGYLGITSLIAYAYGAIAFNNKSLEVVYQVFNARSVIKTTIGGALFTDMVFSTIRVLTLITASFTIGTLLRKKTAGIILSFIIFFGIVSTIFSSFDFQIITLSANYSLNSYFIFGGNNMQYGNFFVSLAVLAVYWAGMLASTYLVVGKRDIA